jgi:hypothetical protein
MSGAGGRHPFAAIFSWAALPALAVAIAIAASPCQAAPPRIDYMLDCMGCHVPDGSGAPGKVPSLRESLVPLAGTPAGRRYLIEVPGASQSPLSDAALARLLNWMVRHLSARPVPRDFVNFTAEEVAHSRRTRLVNVGEVRARLVGPVARAGSPPRRGEAGKPDL